MGIPEFIWTIVATVSLSMNFLSCSDNLLASYYILAGLVGFNWVRLLFLLFILMVVSIPSGQPSSENSNCCLSLCRRNPQGQPSQEEFKSLWAGYCKTIWKLLMCCCYCRCKYFVILISNRQNFTIRFSLRSMVIGKSRPQRRKGT